MFPRIALALMAALTVAACSKGTNAPQKGAATAGPPLLISNEDVVTIRNASLASGPSITGSIQPERKADLRAEIQAIVLQVMRENGDVVKRGDPLVRLDDTSIRDLLASAESASRAADLAFDQAQRQLERMKTLRSSGMTSAQAMEDAEIRRNTTQSDVEAAKARVVQARQQLERTVVRAPFDGVVSDRKVSAGDTAQVGKELLKVIDPGSMRFEGMVSADQIGAVKNGQPVSFRVNGYGDQEFAGKVRRVNPAANAMTRQVEVLVDFADKTQPKLAGLYAEGRVASESSTAIVIPATSVVRDGDKASAWRLKDNKLEKATLALGDRDPRSGDYAVKTGLAEGDKVIRYPTAMLKDGQVVQASSGPTSTNETTATSTTTTTATTASTAKGS